MKSRLGLLTIIHLAMCMGLVTTIAVFYFVLSPDANLPAEQKQIFLMVAVIMAASSAGAAFFLPNALLAKHRLDGPDGGMEPVTPDKLREMLTAYQSAKIVQWALAEGAGLLGAVFFFLSGDAQFLIIAGGMIVLLLFFRPSSGDFAKRLGVPEHRLPPAS